MTKKDTNIHAFFVSDEDGMSWPFIIVGAQPRRGKVAQATLAAQAAAALQALQEGIEEFDAYLASHVRTLEGRDPARAAVYRAVLYRFRECIAG